MKVTSSGGLREKQLPGQGIGEQSPGSTPAPHKPGGGGGSCHPSPREVEAEGPVLSATLSVLGVELRASGLAASSSPPLGHLAGPVPTFLEEVQLYQVGQGCDVRACDDQGQRRAAWRGLAWSSCSLREAGTQRCRAPVSVVVCIYMCCRFGDPGLGSWA